MFLNHSSAGTPHWSFRLGRDFSERTLRIFMDAALVSQHTCMLQSPTIKKRSYFNTILDTKSAKSCLKSLLNLRGQYTTAHRAVTEKFTSDNWSSNPERLSAGASRGSENRSSSSTFTCDRRGAEETTSGGRSSEKEVSSPSWSQVSVRNIKSSWCEVKKSFNKKDLLAIDLTFSRATRRGQGKI